MGLCFVHQEEEEGNDVCVLDFEHADPLLLRRSEERLTSIRCSLLFLFGSYSACLQGVNSNLENERRCKERMKERRRVGCIHNAEHQNRHEG